MDMETKLSVTFKIMWSDLNLNSGLSVLFSGIGPMSSQSQLQKPHICFLPTLPPQGWLSDLSTNWKNASPSALALPPKHLPPAQPEPQVHWKLSTYKAT